MDLKPLITIKGTSDLSLSQAHKLIKKFHTICASSSSPSVSFSLSKQDPNVAEDTLDKLSTLMEEIKRRAEQTGEKIPSTTASANMLSTPSKGFVDVEHKSSQKDGKEKKRKREKSEVHEVIDLEASEKKKKKSKKSDK